MECKYKIKISQYITQIIEANINDYINSNNFIKLYDNSYKHIELKNINSKNIESFIMKKNGNLYECNGFYIPSVVYDLGNEYYITINNKYAIFNYNISIDIETAELIKMTFNIYLSNENVNI